MQEPPGSCRDLHEQALCRTPAVWHRLPVRGPWPAGWALGGPSYPPCRCSREAAPDRSIRVVFIAVGSHLSVGADRPLGQGELVPGPQITFIHESTATKDLPPPPPLSCCIRTLSFSASLQVTVHGPLICQAEVCDTPKSGSFPPWLPVSDHRISSFVWGCWATRGGAQGSLLPQG